MSRARAWLRSHASALALVAIVTSVSGTSLLWNAHQVGVYQASQHRAQAAQQQAQRRAGAILEQKLYTTFGRLAALRPPAGDPRANPSRAYLQGQHAALVELGTDLGCKG